MFVRRLVSGVRSSCDASETSCRCARAESSSAASIVLNVDASRESSSRPCTSMRRERSRVSLTSSAVCVSLRTGASAARDTSRPSAAATAMPVPAIRKRKSLMRSSVLSVSLIERATCNAKPFPPTVRTRSFTPASVLFVKYSPPPPPRASARTSLLTGSAARSPNGRTVFPSERTAWT